MPGLGTVDGRTPCERDRDVLADRITRALAIVEGLRREHDGDCWLNWSADSIRMARDEATGKLVRLPPDAPRHCDCDADEHNARVDEALAVLDPARGGKGATHEISSDNGKTWRDFDGGYPSEGDHMIRPKADPASVETWRLVIGELDDRGGKGGGR